MPQVALSPIGISASFGLERLNRFEVAVVSIDWLVLIIDRALLSIAFKRELAETSHTRPALYVNEDIGT